MLLLHSEVVLPSALLTDAPDEETLNTRLLGFEGLLPFGRPVGSVIVILLLCTPDIDRNFDGGGRLGSVFCGATLGRPVSLDVLIAEESRGGAAAALLPRSAAETPLVDAAHGGTLVANGGLADCVGAAFDPFADVGSPFGCGTAWWGGDGFGTCLLSRHSSRGKPPRPLSASSSSKTSHSTIGTRPTSALGLAESAVSFFGGRRPCWRILCGTFAARALRGSRYSPTSSSTISPEFHSGKSAMVARR